MVHTSKESLHGPVGDPHHAAVREVVREVQDNTKTFEELKALISVFYQQKKFLQLDPQAPLHPVPMQ